MVGGGCRVSCCCARLIHSGAALIKATPRSATATATATCVLLHQHASSCLLFEPFLLCLSIPLFCPSFCVGGGQLPISSSCPPNWVIQLSSKTQHDAASRASIRPSIKRRKDTEKERVEEAAEPKKLIIFTARRCCRSLHPSHPSIALCLDNILVNSPPCLPPFLPACLLPASCCPGRILFVVQRQRYRVARHGGVAAGRQRQRRRRRLAGQIMQQSNRSKVADKVVEDASHSFCPSTICAPWFVQPIN